MAYMPLSSLQCGSAAVVWGWTDPQTEKEYALLACNTGVSFVDITSPAAPVFVGHLPGAAANSSWRDVKTIGNYAYVGSEASGHGIQVFDLTHLRNVTNPPATFAEDAHYAPVGRSHTLATNPSNNMLYAAGSQNTCSGDLHQINVANPLAPTGAGCVALNGYVHEAQCVTYTGPDIAHQGKQICVTSNGRFDDSDTVSIVDVTNPAAPVQLSRVSYAGRGYTHQSWLTEDQQYMLLNDEFDEEDFNHPTRTYVWNVKNLDAPQLMGYFSGRTAAIDHNIYIRGNYAFCSNYRAGLSILDIRNIAQGPAGLTEFGYFDIYPSDDQPGYNGAWGNYPYFQSGTVVVSGIEQGLYILKPQFLPTLTVNDVSVTEGTGASPRLLTFTVTLSAPSPLNTIVQYSTANGTATAGTDYVAASGSIVIPAGETTRTKQIGIVGDGVLEGDETFYLNLSSAINAEIADNQGAATIIDDDTGLSMLSIGDAAVAEGDSGTKEVTVTVTRSAPLAGSASVEYATADGTATSGDYSGGSGTIAFADGESSKSVIFSIAGDLTIEPNESFSVVLTNPVNAGLADSEGAVTIINDDILEVTGLSPTSGPAAGGTVVNLTGSRFHAGMSVHFGDTDATNVTVVSDTTATATTVAMPAATLLPVAAHQATFAPTDIRHRALVTFFSDFIDVSADHLFHSAIEKLYRLGVTSGCGGGAYCPNDPVRRYQMSVFLLRSKFGSVYTPPAATGVFADLPADSPYAAWAEKLYADGVTAGCLTDPLRYCPSDEVTRAQMAIFLLKTKEGGAYTPPACVGTFTDLPCSSPIAPWAEELFRRGITSGCGDGNYCPSDAVTRGQMAHFLVQTFGLQPD